MMQKKFLLWLIILLLGFGCAKKQEPDEEEETVASNVEVGVAKVEQGTIRQIVETGGTLNALPDRDVKVSSLVAGRITELHAIEGETVTSGQVLAKIDDSALRDEYLRTKAALENAKANADRITKLFERGISAGKEKEDAKRDLVAAQADFDTAKVQLSRTSVHSPIDGSVVKRFVSIGEQVDGTAGQPIAEVANFDPIELTASLQSSYLATVHEGADADVTVDAFPDRVFHGKLISILAAVDPTTNAATGRIRIQNSDHTLKGGMFATARIAAGVHSDSLNIPAEALVVTNNEPKVFVVGNDSKVQETKVETGWRDSGRVEILKGLQKGQVVVTTGSYGLADGMSVKPK